MAFRALPPKERPYWVQQQESAVLLSSRHLYHIFINFFKYIYPYIYPHFSLTQIRILQLSMP